MASGEQIVDQRSESSTVEAVDEKQSSIENPLLASSIEDEISIIQALPPSSHRKRWYLHALTNIALSQELLFLFFQYIATAQGLEHLGVEQNTAKAIALPLALNDWLVNVLSVSVPADADSVLFPVRALLPRRWAMVEGLINSISLLGSYSAGAAADALPLLVLVPQDSHVGQVLSINYALILVNILPGASYYQLFNHNKIAKHVAAFKALCEHPTQPFKRLYHKPMNFLRYSEFLRSALAVVGYRSVNFAFIAQALGPYLFKPTGVSEQQERYLSDGLALTVMLATAVNVTFSRLLSTYERVASEDFDVVSAEEYQVALNEWWLAVFRSRTEACQRVLKALLNVIPNAVTAVGWALFTYSLMTDSLLQWPMSLAVGGLSLLSNSVVEYQSQILAAAVAKLDQLDPPVLVDNQSDTIDRRLNELYGAPHFHHVEAAVLDVPEQASPNLSERFLTISEQFEQLTATFSLTKRWNALLTTINIAARSARCIGFYGFVKTLATTLATYSGAELSDTQILALCFMLAPENFKNELTVFGESMKGVILGWQAKCYVEHLRLDRALTFKETMQICLRTSPYDFNLHDIQQALVSRRPVASCPVEVHIDQPSAPLTETLASQRPVQSSSYQLLHMRTPTARCAIM